MKPPDSSQRPESASTSSMKIETVKALVQKHHVYWEVQPEQIPVVEDRPLTVGFNLMLYGTHAPEEHPVPGCEKCQAVYKDLRIIARWILPKEHRATRYEIEIFDSALRYLPKQGNKPVVMLAIKILHRSEYAKPVDACEVQCLTEMKAKLSELGAREGR